MNAFENQDMTAILSLQLLDVPESTRLEMVVSTTSSNSSCC